MPGGPEQRLVLVLAVDLDQRLAELLEESERGVRVVQEHPAATAPHELAPHDELAVLEGDPVVLEQRDDRALPGRVEDGFDRGGLGAGADGLGRLGPLAEQKRQGVDRDRLPRPRLAGEYVQARPEGDGQRLDDGEVTDPELSEHSQRPP
jgi:hypothetical protein